jgi:hypothetical protein
MNEPQLEGWFSKIASVVTGGGSNVIQASVTTAEKGITAISHGDIKSALLAAVGGIGDAGKEFANFLKAPGDLSNNSLQHLAPGSSLANLSARVTKAGDKGIDVAAPIILTAIASYFTGGIYAACASLATSILDAVEKAKVTKQQAEYDAQVAIANSDLEKLKQELYRLQTNGVHSPPGYNMSIATTALVLQPVKVVPAPPATGNYAALGAAAVAVWMFL